MQFTIGLKDCEISYFSGSGAGGQHRNKHQNCVRLFHKESNVRVVAQSHREKRANELDAITRLARDPRFRFWASERVKEMEGRQTIAQAVEEQLKSENLVWEEM